MLPLSGTLPSKFLFWSCAGVGTLTVSEVEPGVTIDGVVDADAETVVGEDVVGELVFAASLRLDFEVDVRMCGVRRLSLALGSSSLVYLPMLGLWMT